MNSSGSDAKHYGYFDYDNRGNITHNSYFSMTYNLANQMISANGNSYLYDGHNRRVRSNEKGELSYSMYSQSGQLLYRKDSSGETNYLYLGSRLVAKQKDSTTTFVHTDNVGSPVAETNEAGSVTERMHYKPFGDTYETPKDDVGYTGHKFDVDLGLSYMQARYYDPVIGRFYSNDPIDAIGHLSTPNGIHGFNRYAYANNNPYKYTDPTGESSYNPQGMSVTMAPTKESAQALQKQFAKPMSTDNTVKLMSGAALMTTGNLVPGGVLMIEAIGDVSLVEEGLNAAGVDPELASNIDAAADIAGGLKALPQGLKKVMDNFSPSTESAMQKEIVNAIADTAGATVDADNAIEDLKEQ